MNAIFLMKNLKMREIMDYFKVNKYSSVEENILYISSNIIELLKGSEKSLENWLNYMKKSFVQK